MNYPNAANEEIHLRLADPPPCAPCGGPSLLLVRFPNSWTNASGDSVGGVREAVLCPACDRGKPDADTLLALFTVDDQIDFDNMKTFGGLVAAWVESLRQTTVDLDVLADEQERWRRGEL